MRLSLPSLLLGSLLAIPSTSAVAQQGAAVRWGPRLSRLAPVTVAGDSTSLQAAERAALMRRMALGRSADYRWEGAAIGAGALGLGSAVLLAYFCGLSDAQNEHCTSKTIGGALVGAALGAVAGGLIGSAIHKHPTDLSPELP